MRLAYEDKRDLYCMGHNVKTFAFFGYSGDPGWPFNQTGSILLPRYPLTYVNLHTKYGNNPIRIFKVIVRTMKDLRNVIQC